VKRGSFEYDNLELHRKHGEVHPSINISAPDILILILPP